MDIDAIEAMWVLGMLPRERLPEIAADALQDGIDNDEVRALASLSAGEVDEAPRLFEEALRHVGRGQLSKKEAVRLYARSISGQIVRGVIEPYDGAKKIWEAALKASDAEFHDVDPFIYAASEYEDRPADREFFKRAIHEEAQSWIVIQGTGAEKGS